VPEAARLLAEHGISAVPVVDEDNRVIGMVSEGGCCTGPKPAPNGAGRGGWTWWRRPISWPVNTSSRTAVGEGRHDARRDVGHRGDPVADIAVLLETNRIKRVPVLRDGKLVGIVSRANLVRALAMTINEAADGAEVDDRWIRDKLLAELKAQKWAEVSPANVTVKEGVVHLWSSYLSEQEKRALVVAAESIPGVRRVEDHMRPVAAYLLG
jgi:CBS domain-containing protein